jgi:hypothetical protein
MDSILTLSPDLDALSIARWFVETELDCFDPAFVAHAEMDYEYERELALIALDAQKELKRLWAERNGFHYPDADAEQRAMICFPDDLNDSYEISGE